MFGGLIDPLSCTAYIKCQSIPTELVPLHETRSVEWQLVRGCVVHQSANRKLFLRQLWRQKTCCFCCHTSIVPPKFCCEDQCWVYEALQAKCVSMAMTSLGWAFLWQFLMISRTNWVWRMVGKKKHFRCLFYFLLSIQKLLKTKNVMTSKLTVMIRKKNMGEAHLYALHVFDKHSSRSSNSSRSRKLYLNPAQIRVRGKQCKT